VIDVSANTKATQISGIPDISFCAFRIWLQVGLAPPEDGPVGSSKPVGALTASNFQCLHLYCDVSRLRRYATSLKIL
jgi:hypothetical protein